MTPTNTLATILTAFQTTVTTASLYGVFSTVMPFVGSMVLVVLGITVLRRVIKGTSKLRIRL